MDKSSIFSRYESSSFDQSINNLTPIAGPTDLVVYEMQVSDLTWDQTWTGNEANRGKYLGLIEEGNNIHKWQRDGDNGF